MTENNFDSDSHEEVEKVRNASFETNRRIFKEPSDKRSQRRISNYQRPAHMSHYDVIGVSSTATSQDIRKAYLARAKALHPDMNSTDPDAVERFIDLQQAYSILSDAAQRHAYDQKRKPLTRKSAIRYPVRTEPDYWVRTWEKETVEERDARRERYRRFATGEFADVVEGGCCNKGVPDWFVISSIILTFSVALVAWSRWWDAGKQSDIDYDDPVVASDTRTVSYTAAYLNPFTFEWNRLDEHQDPPTPAELAQFYQRHVGPLTVNEDVYPTQHLTVTQLPRTKTTLPVLYREKKTGHLVAPSIKPSL